MRGCGDPLGDSNRGSSKSSSLYPVAGLAHSKDEGGDESKEDQKLLHDELLDFPQWMSELKCWIQVLILLLFFSQLTFRLEQGLLYPSIQCSVPFLHQLIFCKPHSCIFATCNSLMPGSRSGFLNATW